MQTYGSVQQYNYVYLFIFTERISAKEIIFPKFGTKLHRPVQKTSSEIIRKLDL